MKSLDATYTKFSSRGVDGASGLLGIGLGLRLALQVINMRQSDLSTVYSAVATFSRLCAITGTYSALVGDFLVARIPWVERGAGHHRLVTWHRKLGPWTLYLIGFHVFFIILSSAGQDGVKLAVEMWRMLNGMSWMWPAMAGFLLMILAGLFQKRRQDQSKGMKILQFLRSAHLR